MGVDESGCPLICCSWCCRTSNWVSAVPISSVPLQWLIPAVTAAWGIWTWAHNQSRERRIERARLSALYVTPFLSACEDLQSRIYSILELEGLPTLRRRYSSGAYAEETLYLIVRYFGWLVTMERHGPYTDDPVPLQLATAVRSAFSVSESPHEVGPFNFFLPEQKALGKLVMMTREGEYGIENDTISFYDFTARLASPPLSESESITETLEALRNADDAGSLAGRERLAKAQGHLVDLLGYLEAKEGYTLFRGKRKKCRHWVEPDTAAGKSALRALPA